ncbi:hypothetical protein LWI28_022867 [Acer negundo]|uniref:Uncharacterized protein n=1 Tax=Acer negundo TaxID=4023 RepID=A0AAD5NM78_ACENE|nr:hypothetical protein LWI28_022867 [Acer negundo]
MSSIQVVPETQMVNEQGIELVVDLRRQEREDTVIEANKGRKMAEVCSESDNGELSKMGGNCGGFNREGSETSSIRRVKRHRGKANDLFLSVDRFLRNPIWVFGLSRWFVNFRG